LLVFSGTFSILVFFYRHCLARKGWKPHSSEDSRYSDWIRGCCELHEKVTGWWGSGRLERWNEHHLQIWSWIYWCWSNEVIEKERFCSC